MATALLSLAACAPPNGHPPAVTPDTVKSSPPKITTAELLGQSDAWLLGKMGEPDFKRTDLQANLWQYKNGTCMLNVFLYSDGPSIGARVLHFDARDIRGRDTDRDQCLSIMQD